MSEIFQLSQLISSSVSLLESTGAPLPSIDEPWTPASDSFHSSHEASQAVNVIVAAAHQLIATLLAGPLALGEFSNSHLKSAALKVALGSNTTEILREAGPNGLLAEEIAAKAGLDGNKLARVLRFLCTHHIYQELSPNVFANNRLSSLMDSGKSHEQLVQSPDEKDDNTTGFNALLGINLENSFKASVSIWDAISDPATAFSTKPEEAAFSRAFGTNLPFYEEIELPGNERRLKQFGNAMKGAAKMAPPELITSLFNWESLAPGSLVVDVGGGVGSSSMPLAKEFPHLNFVVQDRAMVVEQGKQTWERDLPTEMQSGRISFQGINFFEPQPVKNADVFMLKHVLHNWADDSCIEILKALRAAACPTTKLLIVDAVVPYACRSNSTSTTDAQKAPAPLLTNFGGALAAQYTLDIQMMNLVNAQERTEGEFGSLLEKSGWRLVKIRTSGGNELQSLEVVPIM